jgi:uncharacterized membrane protein required for colicin V production
MYTLPLNTAFWLNWILVVLILLALLQGYARGFVRQLFDLVIFVVSLLGAWFLAFRLGDLLPLLSRNLEIFDHPIWGTFLHNLFNSIVWFVLVLVALTIGLEILLKPIVRMVRERSELRIIDRIMGSVFSFLRTVLWFLLGMVLILSPLITNGRMVMERTLLTPLVPLADTLQTEALKLMGLPQIFREDTLKEDVIADNAKMIAEWLVENGIAEEFSGFIEKGLKQETFTEDDLEKAQAFILENDITQDELIDFLKGIGVDASQIDKALDYFEFED